jgi:hypothetical protein
VLPTEQRAVLRKLGPWATDAGFYLAGGTAVALQLGHRESVDFDWFTSSSLDDPMAFAGLLHSRGIAVTAPKVAPGTLHGRVDGVRCSFLSYRYPLLAPAWRAEECLCDLASLADLSCMKLAAIAQRGARKDFLDIVAVASTGLTLPKMLDLYRRKYGVQDVGHVLAALCYFDDAERDPMPVMHLAVDWDTIKKTVQSWVKDLE